MCSFHSISIIHQFKVQNAPILSKFHHSKGHIVNVSGLKVENDYKLLVVILILMEILSIFRGKTKGTSLEILTINLGFFFSITYAVCITNIFVACKTTAWLSTVQIFFIFLFLNNVKLNNSVRLFLSVN